ncbi:uncharacterized protein [Phaseolus vulgaris]|uniref:uncharacterized protein n=1 Tax=Phaseolus vulgaris TaxID=3885 RepID=UPI0035C9B73B
MEELMNYVHQHGLSEGDYGIHFTTNEAVKGGVSYRKYKDGLEVSVTGTRKCECPFKLRGKPVGKGQGWVLKVICGTHNHDLYDTLVGHPYAGRLKTNEHSMLVDMTKNMVKPGNILRTLKENNEDNMTTIKQIYIARYSYKRSVRGPRTESQQLMMLLDRDNYLHWSTCHKSSNIVSDIFWTHPDAVKLLNAFNIVFLMDTTYKTNKYRLPLLEIVGVTCTDSVEAWEVVMDSWKTIIDYTKIGKFDEFVKIFETICSPWPLLFEYVKNTWIIPHKEKFVKCWTNLLMHLGNTTSNRVESAHWSLKRILQNSMGDLCSCWDAIKHVIILQHNEIKASFQMSLHVIGHTFNVQLYKMLVGSISKHALILIAEEFDRVNDVGFDSE